MFSRPLFPNNTPIKKQILENRKMTPILNSTKIKGLGINDSKAFSEHAIGTRRQSSEEVTWNRRQLTPKSWMT